MVVLHPKLEALVETVRPTLQAERLAETERAPFVYDLLREVCDDVPIRAAVMDASFLQEQRRRTNRGHRCSITTRTRAAFTA